MITNLWLTRDSPLSAKQGSLKAIATRVSRRFRACIARHCVILHSRSTGVSDYVSHIFIMMSNVWQRLLMSAWRLPSQCAGARYIAPTMDTINCCGMEAAQHRVNDPPQKDWQEGYRQDIHALVLLADDYEGRRQQADELCTDVTPHATVCMHEHGWVMWNRHHDPQEYPVEPFGYIDSCSQQAALRQVIILDHQVPRTALVPHRPIADARPSPSETSSRALRREITGRARAVGSPFRSFFDRQICPEVL